MSQPSEPRPNLISFKAPKSAMVRVKEVDYENRCDHWSFEVDEQNRTVECGKCHRHLDAMHALILLANNIRRHQWNQEANEDFTQKQIAKTIKAGVIALHARGVTPEKFTALLGKYCPASEPSTRGGSDAPESTEQSPKKEGKQ